MAGCKREVMEPSGREKVAAAAALVAGLVGMWFMLAYSYVYINCAVFPVAGALILQVADWRMTFWVLAGIGLLCAGLALLFDETLPSGERYEGTVLGSVKQLGAVARNKGFSAFLGIVGLYNLPFMAYIAVGSYVYITFFGLTELEYSMYFAFAALLI